MYRRGFKQGRPLYRDVRRGTGGLGGDEYDFWGGPGVSLWRGPTFYTPNSCRDEALCSRKGEP